MQLVWKNTLRGSATYYPVVGYFDKTWIFGMVMRGQWAVLLQSVETDCEEWVGPGGPLHEIRIAEGECASDDDGRRAVKSVIVKYFKDIYQHTSDIVLKNRGVLMRYKGYEWENHGSYETLKLPVLGLWDYDSCYLLTATSGGYYAVSMGSETIQKGSEGSLLDAKRACFNAMINWASTQHYQLEEIEKDMREELEKLNGS